MVVRFAIVGTGRISSWILKGALQESRFKAVAVCSRTKENAERFINEHPEAFAEGQTKIFTSIDDVCRCSEVDAVYIGTPNSTHCPLSVKCLKAGKHVICEKPLACNEEEVQKMIDAAREGGAVLMEAMISILNPNFRKAVETLPELGPIRHYQSSYCQYSSKYDDLKKGIVANSFNPQMGGGALEDIGIYTVYPVVALFGEPSSIGVSRVTVPSQYGDVDLQGNINMQYDGMTVNLAYSKAVDCFSPTEICGEKGNLQLDAVHICRKVSYAPHGAPASGRGKLSAFETVSEGLDRDEYYYEFKEFCDVIESGESESQINSLKTSLLCRRIMDKVKTQ